MKLKEIDLSKLCLEEEEHSHPDIRTDGTYYLVRFGREYYVDTFSKQWYGIIFDGKYDAGCQMNYSEWNDAELWEIIHS